LKDYGDIDSKFRYVILASMRAKQLLRGAKPRIKTKSRNLIRIAQEEVKRGLVDYEIIQSPKEEELESGEKMFIGEEIAEGQKEAAKEVDTKREKPKKAGQPKKPEKQKKSDKPKSQKTKKSD
jgi:DNA-directed RNA polymerase subunit K/omega